MGGIPSTKINEIDSNVNSNRDAILRDAVENFAEQAYSSGSNVDGLKLVLTNKRARAAFMKFLDEDDDKKNSQFFQDIERLSRSSPTEIAEGAKSLIEQYQKPEVESDVGAANSILSDINSLLSGGEAANADDIKGALQSAMNETIVLMALSVFPRFIGSEAYKEWRKEESSLAVAAASAAANPGGGTAISNSLVTSISDQDGQQNSEFLQSSLSYIQPQKIENLFGSGSWMGAFVSAAEGLPICVTLADANPLNPGFPLIYVNKVFENTTGYKRERIRGTNCRFLQREKSERESIAMLSSALANAQPVKVAITNFRSDGTPFRNLLAMKPVFDTDRKYSFVVGVQFDISTPGTNAKHIRMVDSLLSLLPNVVPRGAAIM